MAHGHDVLTSVGDLAVVVLGVDVLLHGELKSPVAGKEASPLGADHPLYVFGLRQGGGVKAREDLGFDEAVW